MTITSRATLKLSFENGDVPQGSDYGNMIDSALNLADTSTQTMAGPLSVPSLTATSFTSTALTLSTLTVSSTTSLSGTATIANAIITSSGITTLSVSTAIVTNATVSGTITYSAVAYPVLTQSSATGVGTTQAGAAALVGPFCILSAAGGNTAFVLSSLPLGGVQRLFNGSGTTALIYPPSGGFIDGGSMDASISLAGSAVTTIYRYSSVNYLQI